MSRVGSSVVGWGCISLYFDLSGSNVSDVESQYIKNRFTHVVSFACHLSPANEFKLFNSRERRHTMNEGSETNLFSVERGKLITEMCVYFARLLTCLQHNTLHQTVV